MPQVLINSVNRDSSENSNSFIFPIGFPLYNIRKVKLLSVIIPNTIYNVHNSTSQNLNYIQWQSGSNTYSYTIPSGNYTMTTLLSQLQSGMNGVQSNGWSWTYNSTTMLVSVSGTSAFTIQICPQRILGFASSQLNITQATSLTAQNSPNLYSPVNLFLSIKELGDANITSSFNYTFWVPLNVVPGDVQLLSVSNGLPEQVIEFKANPLYALQQLTIKLYDDNHNLINLNNTDWMFLLEVGSE